MNFWKAAGLLAAAPALVASMQSDRTAILEELRALRLEIAELKNAAKDTRG